MQKPQEQRSIFDFNEMQNPRRPIQSGAVPQFVEQRPKNVVMVLNSVPKKWNSVPKSGTGPVSGSQFHEMWNRGPN